jgi:hypothetical protein
MIPVFQTAPAASFKTSAAILSYLLKHSNVYGQGLSQKGKKEFGDIVATVTSIVGFILGAVLAKWRKKALTQKGLPQSPIWHLIKRVNHGPFFSWMEDFFLLGKQGWHWNCFKKHA